MTLRTQNALCAYIDEVNRAIHAVADLGADADLSRLTEATEELRDAIDAENVRKSD